LLRIGRVIARELKGSVSGASWSGKTYRE